MWAKFGLSRGDTQAELTLHAGQPANKKAKIELKSVPEDKNLIVTAKREGVNVIEVEP